MRILLYIVLIYLGIKYIDGMNFVQNMEKTTIFKIVSETDPKRRVLDVFQSEYNLKFPEIVLGQVFHETGRLKSKIYTECHNAVGMKYNDRGYAIGICREHAKYALIEDSLKDYAKWQELYLGLYEQKILHRSCLTKKDYYRFLDWSGYAEDPNYNKKIDKYVAQIELWNLKV